jgi:RNA recognition motif-containing protein
MKTSWADCSSDEEDYSSDDAAEEEEEDQEKLETTALEKLQIDNNNNNNNNNNNDNPSNNSGQQQSSIREYDYPDRAPFNAFVGNLSYDISEVSHLQRALADVVHDRLKEKINIIGAKICYDRNTGDNRQQQHRGFGYVELETLEEVSVCIMCVCVCVCGTKIKYFFAFIKIYYLSQICLQ